MKTVIIRVLVSVYFLICSNTAFGMLRKNIENLNACNKAIFKQNHLIAQYNYRNQLKECYQPGNTLYTDVNDKGYGPNWGYLLQQENEQIRKDLQSQLQNIYDQRNDEDNAVDNDDVFSILVQRTKAIIEQNHLLFEYYCHKQDIRFNEKYYNRSADQKAIDAMGIIEAKMFHLYKKCGVNIKHWDSVCVDTKDRRQLNKKTDDYFKRDLFEQNKNIIQFNHLLSRYDDCKQSWRYYKDDEAERKNDLIQAQSIVKDIYKKHLLRPNSAHVKEGDVALWCLLKQNDEIINQKLYLFVYHYYCLFLHRKNNFEKDELLFFPEKNIYVGKLTGGYGTSDEIICDHENIFTASDGLLACLESTINDIYKNYDVPVDEKWLYYSTMSRK